MYSQWNPIIQNEREKQFLQDEMKNLGKNQQKRIQTKNLEIQVLVPAPLVASDTSL